MVVNVGMLKRMGVLRAAGAKVEMAVSRVTLGKVVVQHRPQGRRQQRHNRQQGQRLRRRSLQSADQ